MRIRVVLQKIGGFQAGFTLKPEDVQPELVLSAKGRDLGYRRGETNEQGFQLLSRCLVGFLFLVVVSQTFLCILGVFRGCYIRCYMLFHGCAGCLVATWSCLGVTTCKHRFQGLLDSL
jgi:hypothetical protein